MARAVDLGRVGFEEDKVCPVSIAVTPYKLAVRGLPNGLYVLVAETVNGVQIQVLLDLGARMHLIRELRGTEAPEPDPTTT